MHDAAKGAELLLLATLLQQYCPNDKDEVDTDSLKVAASTLLTSQSS